MKNLINHGPVISAVLAEAKEHFGHPSTWNRAEVARWVRQRVRGLVDGTDPTPATILPMPPRGFTPVVPADEREAIQAMDNMLTEDGWR